MDWYQHSTSSHDNPDISDAMDLFGHPGYSTFFIVLEIYGDRYNHVDHDGWLTVSKRFLARKLRLSSTKVEQILNFYSEKQRILLKTSKNEVSVKCPKFIDIASNWTKRKPTNLCRPSVGPSVVPTAIEEKKKGIEENIASPSFKKPKEGEAGGTPPPASFEPGEKSVESGEDEIDFGLFDPKNLAKKPEATKGHFSDQITDRELIKQLQEVCKFWKPGNGFNPWQFIQRNQKRHPKAILHTLVRLKEAIQKGVEIRTPWPFAEKVCKIESKNFREADAIAAHERLKEDLQKLYPREA